MKGQMIMLLMIGVWIGLLLGLSFIETPLKFIAPGMTTELGVGIGRIIFSVLNKIEVLFAVLLLTFIAMNKSYLSMDVMHSVSVILLIGLLVMQTAWLLPTLDIKAQALLDGLRDHDNDYDYHILYVVAEVSKVMILFIMFCKFYKI